MRTRQAADHCTHPGMLCGIAGAGIIMIAAALRLPLLENRPMHGDEAVHAAKFDELRRTGAFLYDPYEFHGPTLHFATLPVAWARGAARFADLDEAMLRFVPAVFGAALVALVGLLGDALGRRAALIAAAILAVSPTMVFYSRYYIPEMLLAFASLAAIATGWRYGRSGRARWAFACGASVGFMHATKETSLIAFGCMLAALLAVRACSGKSTDCVIIAARQPKASLRRHILVGFLAAAVVSTAFFSSFGRTWRGPLDSVTALKTYFFRGVGGEGLHLHPPGFYIARLAAWHDRGGYIWTEGALLFLALAGAIAVMRARFHVSECRNFARFGALYAILICAVYAAIPYKTPWCAAQMIVPLALLAGIGADALLRAETVSPARFAFALLLLAGLLHLGFQSARITRADYHYAAAWKNPYIYAHPLRGAERAADQVERVAAAHPDGRRMLVRVVLDDPWPLPWVLRRMERVGYWESASATGDAPVIITTTTMRQDVEARLTGEYIVSHYGLRPDVTLAVYTAREWLEALDAAPPPTSKSADSP